MSTAQTMDLPTLWVVGGLLSLLLIVATALVRTSYGRVEAALAKIETTLEALKEESHAVREWRKGVDRRLSVLERKVFAGISADNTPGSE